MIHNKRIVGLDVARGVAILMVLLCHFTESLNQLWPRRFVGLIFATYGVELFFVLSGFLIGGILLRQYERDGFSSASLVPFWVRRWFRTLPNYYLFLLIALCCTTVFGQSTIDAWRYPLFWQNLFANHANGFFQISWSLCVEEWMYLILPLLLLGFHRQFGKKAAPLWTIGLLLAFPLVLRLLTTQGLEFDNGVRKLVVLRLDAIALGVGLAWVSLHRPNWWARLTGPGAFWGSLTALVALSAILLPLMPPRGGASSLLLTFLSQLVGYREGGILAPWVNALFPFAIDLAFAGVVARASTVSTLGARANRFWIMVSTLSYSLYLCHNLLRDAIDQVWLSLHLPGGMATFPLRFVLYVAAAFTLSALVFRYFEKPMTDLRDRWKTPLPARQAGMKAEK